MSIEPKTMDLLMLLIEANGQVLSADDILDRLWPDSVVEISAVHRRIAELRRALGDDSRHPRYIETISKRGYRIIATNSTADSSVSRRQLIGALAAIFLALAGVATWFFYPSDETTPDVPVIAILPLDDFSSQTPGPSLSAGLQEDLTRSIATIEQVRVISRTSVSRLPKDLTIPKIGELLGATHILEGSVRKEGSATRIVLQLIATSTDHHVWSATYDMSSDELLDLQTEVASRVASELGHTLLSEGGYETSDREVYELYLTGRSLLLERKPEASAQAIQLFRDALKRQPDFGPAHAGIALGMINRLGSGASDALSRTGEELLKAAQRGVKLTPDHSDTNLALAEALYLLTPTDPDVDVFFSRSLALNPYNTQALEEYAFYLALVRDDVQQARRLLEFRLELDPLNPIAHLDMALPYFLQGNVEGAELAVQQSLRLDPELRQAHSTLYAMRFHSGQWESAIDSLSDWTSANPGASTVQSELLAQLIRVGRYADAQTYLQRIDASQSDSLSLQQAKLQILSGSAGELDALRTRLGPEDDRLLELDAIFFLFEANRAKLEGDEARAMRLNRSAAENFDRMFAGSPQRLWDMHPTLGTRYLGSAKLMQLVALMRLNLDQQQVKAELVEHCTTPRPECGIFHLITDTDTNPALGDPASSLRTSANSMFLAEVLDLQDDVFDIFPTDQPGWNQALASLAERAETIGRQLDRLNGGVGE